MRFLLLAQYALQMTHSAMALVMVARQMAMLETIIIYNLLSGSFPSVRLTNDGKFFSVAFVIACGSAYKNSIFKMNILFDMFLTICIRKIYWNAQYAKYEKPPYLEDKNHIDNTKSWDNKIILTPEQS